jgi:hypothetical protein
MVRFLTIYNDDAITKSILSEVIQIIYYGHVSYSDIMTTMSYNDRSFWIKELKSILKDSQPSTNSTYSIDDNEVINRLNSINMK